MFSVLFVIFSTEADVCFLRNVFLFFVFYKTLSLKKKWCQVCTFSPVRFFMLQNCSEQVCCVAEQMSLFPTFLFYIFFFFILLFRWTLSAVQYSLYQNLDLFALFIVYAPIHNKGITPVSDSLIYSLHLGLVESTGMSTV